MIDRDKILFNNYAEYNFRGIFVSQGGLCQYYSSILQPSGINVLTARLCLAQKAFRELFEIRMGCRQRTREDYCEDVANSGAVSGMPKCIVCPTDSLGERVEISLIEPFENLYSFCSFSVSALDRVAYEINELYNLKLKVNRVDWRNFGVDKRGEEKEGSTELKKKNLQLEKILTNGNFDDLLKYRDVLEHRGFLKLSASNFGPGFDFCMPNDPDNPSLNIKTPITSYCKDQFKEILKLCNDVYSEIYDDAKDKKFNLSI